MTLVFPNMLMPALLHNSAKKPGPSKCHYSTTLFIVCFEPRIFPAHKQNLLWDYCAWRSTWVD